MSGSLPRSRSFGAAVHQRMCSPIVFFTAWSGPSQNSCVWCTGSIVSLVSGLWFVFFFFLFHCWRHICHVPVPLSTSFYLYLFALGAGTVSHHPACLLQHKVCLTGQETQILKDLFPVDWWILILEKVLSVSASFTCTSWNHSAFGRSDCWRAPTLHLASVGTGRLSVKITSTSSLSLSQLGAVPLRHLFPNHEWSTNLCLALVLSFLLLPLGSSSSLDLGRGPLHEVVGVGLCCHRASRHSAHPGWWAAEEAFWEAALLRGFFR